MAKRVFAGAMWLLATVYGWNLLAFAAGAPELPGIVLGIAAGLFVGVDPMRRIWPRGEAGVPVARPASSTLRATRT
jgi:hypothetical protein